MTYLLKNLDGIILLCNFARSNKHLMTMDRTYVIKKLYETRNYISKEYGVSSLILFGSYATEEQTENSDIDVCVEMEPNLYKRVGLKKYLEEYMHLPVDVVRKNKNMDPFFSNQIDKYGIIVF